MVAVIILSPNGEKRILKTGQITDIPTGAAVAKAVRKTKPAEEVGRFTVADGEILVWGWTEGKKGSENKHSLPGSLVRSVLYSDIVLTYTTDKDLTMDVWDKVLSSVSIDDIPVPAPLLKKTLAASKKVEVLSPLLADSESECSEDEEIGSVVEEEIEESEEEESDEEEADVSEAEEEEDDDGGSCNDEEEGGGKRRSARRRTSILQEFRRMEMGLRSRVRFPAPPGKRAPRWQTALSLVKEEYITVS